MQHPPLIEALVALLVLVAAVTDFRSRRIPNWLTLPGICAGLLANGVLAGWAGLKMSATGLLLGFGLYFALYALRAMGAGDVKLMGAVGAFVGPASWIWVFVASSAAGGILAIVLMVWKGRVRQTLTSTLFIVHELAHFRAPYQRDKRLDVKSPDSLNLPHGVAIALGTIACMILSLI